MGIPDWLRNRGAAFTHDFLMIPAAWLGAFWLRFNLERIPRDFWEAAVQALPLVLVIQALVLWRVGLYRGVWRFASMPDLIRIIKGVLLGAAIAAVLLFLATRLEGVPRSIFPMYGALLVLALGGSRLLYRWLKDHRLYNHAGERVLIVGAGQGGELLARDLRRDHTSELMPVAFVDDNPAKVGRDVHGIPVRGTSEDIPEVVRRHDIDLIFIAVPSATSEVMQRVVELCEETGKPFRTLPGMKDLVSGRVSVNALREVSIEDLLGREPVKLDWAAVRHHVEGRVVMVTGGGGSIGAELCRQLAAVGPSRLVVLDQSEHNLFRIEQELEGRYPRLELVPWLGDVCDARSVHEAMFRHRPAVVYHAAAYKHVPMLQHQAREAARNNILGTRTVAGAACEAEVETFVLISTDKAVNPTNTMGATKRVAEMVCQWLADGSVTRFVTVRFGNVLDSAGSVVPTFREQIARGGPVTVTHPEVQRYFMTIPEACQLIMQAGAVGKGGEIFVLDMGEPVRIQYLAEQMIRLSGRTPGEDIPIVYTGLRPGEKLFEELFHPEERVAGTPHEKLLLARVRPVEGHVLSRNLKGLEAACAGYDEAEVLAIVRALVPELRVPERSAEKVVRLAAARQARAEGAGGERAGG